MAGKSKLSWFVRYWLWNPSALPLWATFAVTSVYVALTYGLWSGQKEANQRQRNNDSISERHYAADRDSTYRHFREAQDTANVHFWSTLQALLLQHDDASKLAKAHLYTTDLTMSPVVVTYTLHNSGTGAANIWRMTTGFSNGANAIAIDSVPFVMTSGIQQRVSIYIPLNLKPQSKEWVLSFLFEYTDDFGNEWVHSEAKIFNETTGTARFVYSKDERTKLRGSPTTAKIDPAGARKLKSHPH